MAKAEMNTTIGLRKLSTFSLQWQLEVQRQGDAEDVGCLTIFVFVRFFLCIDLFT